ncbi:MAG: DUF1476 domain-containing protein [Alphaproteobacteria bacterium]|nr:DUF1476 domain-containing protein [Alphaproteobacteria bacterium]
MVDIRKTSKAHEQKHQQDEALEFKAVARRNKLAGLWAAELLGLIGQAAMDYAKDVVHADFEEKGDEDVVRKLAKDLDGKADHQTIREKLGEFLHIARKQVQDEHKS